jgi:hypothetical protein
MKKGNNSFSSVIRGKKEKPDKKKIKSNLVDSILQSSKVFPKSKMIIKNDYKMNLKNLKPKINLKNKKKIQ